MDYIPNKVKESFLIWLGTTVFFGLGVFTYIKNNLGISDENWIIILLIPFLVGVVSLLILIVSSTQFIYKLQKLSERKLLVKVLRTILILAFMPLLIIKKILWEIKFFETVKRKEFATFKEKNILKNLGFTLLIILSLIPLWASVYFVSIYIPAYMVGFIEASVPIAGTGSMYPTFPKGQGKDPKELGKQIVATAGMKLYPNGIKIGDLNLFGHEIERGDIVIAENDEIRKIGKELYGEESGIVKRVVALPGDKILIRDGLVYLNGNLLKEPYIATPRSTFGGDFLTDCEELEIPSGKLFIMGDNRKGSGDSRHDGLIDFKDISYVLPYKNQLGKLDKGWHDPTNDDKESSRTTLDKNKYISLLNEKRKEAKIKSLNYQPKLERSSFFRGENILKFDDFSYEATKSGYTQEKAMRDAGYSNIVWNEGIIQGNYSAEELIEYLLEFPDWKENLLEVKDYQELGIAEVRGEINGCPRDVIVQHFAGYVPPNYTQETIQSWGRLISDLNNVIPGWEELIGNKYVNQSDLNKLIGLMYQQKRQAEAIYYRMKANQWLTDQENKYVDQDKPLSDQIDALAKKLNEN